MIGGIKESFSPKTKFLSRQAVLTLRGDGLDILSLIINIIYTVLPVGLGLGIGHPCRADMDDRGSIHLHATVYKSFHLHSS